MLFFYNKWLKNMDKPYKKNLIMKKKRIYGKLTLKFIICKVICVLQVFSQIIGIVSAVCPNLLTLRLDAPTAITIPYVDGGVDLSNNYLDFFDETPSAGCSFTCNYGNTCGPATSLSNIYVG